jgi:hypothetical protein
MTTKHSSSKSSFEALPPTRFLPGLDDGERS